MLRVLDGCTSSPTTFLRSVRRSWSVPEQDLPSLNPQSTTCSRRREQSLSISLSCSLSDSCYPYPTNSFLALYILPIPAYSEPSTCNYPSSSIVLIVLPGIDGHSHSSSSYWFGTPTRGPYQTNSGRWKLRSVLQSVDRNPNRPKKQKSKSKNENRPEKSHA